MLSELGGKLMYTVKTNKELENTKMNQTKYIIQKLW